MRKRLIKAHNLSSILIVVRQHVTYAIPLNIANKFIVSPKNLKNLKETVSLEKTFEKLNKKYTKAGALLKGLRHRENLTQAQFAKKIKVTQANLSAMETGRRSIGKIIAKRIEKIFGTNYRSFLE